MPRFQDIVTDNEGNGLPGAIVTVRDYPSGNLSTLTADSGGLLTNPIVADANGAYYFNAANAIYSLEFRLLAYEPAREVRLVNLGNLVDSVTLADSTSAANGAGLIGFNSTLSYVTGTVGGFLNSLPTTGGAALIGANDASSGSIFTTVAGFIAKLLSSAGSSVIGFIRSETGATTRTVQSKLRDSAHALDFGLVGDGSDETAKLTNFFNSAIANPGVPHRLDQKTYGISSVLPTINVDGVIIGAVRGTFHDDPPTFSGTTLKWLGTSNAGKMLTVTPVNGASGQYLTGIVLRGIGFDCNSLIATGVRIESVRNSEFLLAGANSTSALFDLGVTAGVLGEGLDLQDNLFRLYGRQVEQATGLCLQLGGNSTANVSFNDFYCTFEHSNSPAVNLVNSDNNVWHRWRCFCVVGGTATESVHFLGGTSNGVASRAERIIHFSANKAPKIYGTADYTAASTQHRFVNYDIENGTPAPVLGTAAWVDCEMPQTFTPTVTGAAGTGLTTGTIIGSYIRNNNFCDVDISVQVTAGTGYTSLTFTLPFVSAGTVGQSAIIVEAATSNKSFNGYNAPTTNTLVLHSPDGSTALPTGTYAVSFRYRVR